MSQQNCYMLLLGVSGVARNGPSRARPDLSHHDTSNE